MTIYALDELVPQIDPTAFVAPGATVIGSIVLAADASVWFGAVLRGDIGFIHVGARSNLQDGVLAHMTEGLSNTTVGCDVTVGHGAILHGCTVGDRCLIGMGSILLDNCEVGEDSVVAAGTVVPPRMKIPPRSLVRGTPAKIIREVTDTEREMGPFGADHYVTMMRRFKGSLVEVTR